jgi:ribosomal protein S18 acetylase RimI-like enzyme
VLSGSIRMTDPHRLLPVRIVGATEVDLGVVGELAGHIWRQHYPGIITPEQIEYMLARGYSRDALRRFVDEAGAGLVLAYAGQRLVAFAAYHRTDHAGEIKLDKLYVHPEYHGRGVGSRLIAHVEGAASAQRRRTIVLNVNKNNVKAIAAYEKNGFAVRESVVVDIGSGFVMDDYVMAKQLPL